MSKDQIKQNEHDKVQNLLIPMHFPCFPPTSELGPSTSVANPVFSAKDYKSYATNKNIPAELKGQIANLAKATGEISGYDGTISKQNQRHGKGVQMYQDGTILDGYWRDDQFIKGRMMQPKQNGENLSEKFGSGWLKITLREATLTHDADAFGKMDPYVVFDYAGKEWKTKVAENAGKTPKWNQTFLLPVIDSNNAENVRINMVIKDEDLGGSDLVGECTPTLSRLLKPGSFDFPVMYKNKIAGKLEWTSEPLQQAPYTTIASAWDPEAFKAMKLPEEKAPSCLVMTGIFNQNGRVNQAILKADSGLSYDGDLDENTNPSCAKVKLEWKNKLFTCTYSGAIESSVLKQGKLDIKLGDKVVQSIEGVFDVKLNIDKPTAVQTKSVNEEKKEETLPSPQKGQKTPSPAKAQEKTPSPAKAQEKTPSPAKVQEQTPSPVKESPKKEENKIEQPKDDQPDPADLKLEADFQAATQKKQELTQQIQAQKDEVILLEAQVQDLQEKHQAALKNADKTQQEDLSRLEKQMKDKAAKDQQHRKIAMQNEHKHNIQNMQNGLKEIDSTSSNQGDKTKQQEQARIEQETKKIQQQIKAKESEIEKSKKTVQDLTKQHDEAEQKKNEFEHKLQTQQQQKDEVIQKQKSLEDDLVQSKQTLASLEKEFTQQQNSSSKPKAKKEDNSVTDEQLQKVKEMLAKKMKEIAKASSQRDDYVNNLDTLTRDHKSATRDLKNKIDKFSKSPVTSSRRQQDQAEEKVKKQIEAQKKALSDLSAQHEEHKAQIDAMNQEIDDLTQSNSSLQKQVAAAASAQATAPDQNRTKSRAKSRGAKTPRNNHETKEMDKMSKLVGQILAKKVLSDKSLQKEESFAKEQAVKTAEQKTQNTDKKEQLVQMKKDLAKLTSASPASSNSKLEIVDIEKQERQMADQTKKVNANIKKLQAKLDSLEKRDKEIRDEISQIQSQHQASVQKSSNSLDQQLVKLEAQLVTHQEQQKSLQNAQANLTRERTVFENECKQLDLKVVNEYQLMQTQKTKTKALEAEASNVANTQRSELSKMDMKMEQAVKDVDSEARMKGMMFGGVTFLVGTLIGYSMMLMQHATS